MAELKREFGGNNELAKIAELKQVEQDSRIMEEFIQKGSKREQIQRMSVNWEIQAELYEENSWRQKALYEILTNGMRV